MYIDNLVIEVTRKCNLRCQHCLRGDPQKLTMSRDVLCAALQDVEYISYVTFTGGEPSLAPEVIENFIEELIWRKISIGSFFIATNGKTRNGFNRFLKAVRRLYDFCDEKEGCALVVSRDQYHQELFQVDLNRFREGSDSYGRPMYGYEYGDFPPYFDPEARKAPIWEPLDEGRAKESGVGSKKSDNQSRWTIIRRNDDARLDVNEHPVYIASNGNVTSCCDWSFKHIDQESLGNVLQKPLAEIVESFSEAEKEVA